MSNHIKLIVGLGNPGPQYQFTRHNAGAWLIEDIANYYRSTLKPNTKFFGLHQKLLLEKSECHLLIPTTFMNHSGKAVAAICNYYNINANQILIAHDELDLPPGKIKLKFDGGHGGHNGLRDIIKALNTNAFYRLRLGIGHPGHRDKVHDFVLNQPSKTDKSLIDDGITRTLNQLETLVSGKIDKAMQVLHSDS
tara:strand:- start:181 stop:762 length:582 start_codon:yes stop_codon:yes gene_type:complete